MLSYQSLDRFARSRKIFLISFLWGLCEAAFFFIVPDVFFMLIAFINPKKGMISAFFSVLGSVVGGAIMYALSSHFPVPMINFLTCVPLISIKLIQHVKASLILHGFNAMFLAPLHGIPYKIYAVVSAQLNLNPIHFLLISIPVRLERVVCLALVCGLLGKIFKRQWVNNSFKCIILYGILWVSFYIFYAKYILSSY